MSEHRFIDFNHLKSTVSIEQVLTAYQISGLKKSGDQLRGKCPIHGGNNDRQFVIWPHKGSWRCFGSCQRSGDMIQLVSLLLDISNFEAAHDIAGRFGIATQKGKKPKPAARRPATPEREPGDGRKGAARRKSGHVQINRPPEKLKPLDYLQSDHPVLLKRGILSDTAEYFGVGYASKGTMAGRIAIPVHSMDGQLLAYAGAATKAHQKQWRFPKDFVPELEIFNAHRLPDCDDDDQTLTIALDPLNILELFEQGDEHGVALICKAVSKTQLDKLDQIITRHAYRHLVIRTDEHMEIGQNLFAHFANKDQINTNKLHWQRAR